MSIEETLKERGDRYGEFKDNSKVMQSIKRAMRNSIKWDSLSDDKKEALEMIAHKIGRILTGDSEYADSWHDIAGFATLVEQELIRNKKTRDPEPQIGRIDNE